MSLDMGAFFHSYREENPDLILRRARATSHGSYVFANPNEFDHQNEINRDQRPHAALLVPDRVP